MDAYKNNGLGSGGDMFSKMGTIAGGTGDAGSNVRFADIDGKDTNCFLQLWSGIVCGYKGRMLTFYD